MLSFVVWLVIISPFLYLAPAAARAFVYVSAIQGNMENSLISIQANATPII
jgi:hypothetical protein